jgi:hypothetical protein
MNLPVSRPQHQVNVEDVRRFARALGLAVRDKELEEFAPPLVFYYDADVVLSTVHGLTFDPMRLPDPSDHRLAVRALLSMGRLGPLRLLRPHLIEFDRVLHSWPSVSTTMRIAFHKAQLNHLVKAWQLQRYEDKLRAAVTGESPIHADRTDQSLFAELIHDEGFELFVKLELCYGGTWEQRLNRLRRKGLLKFESSDALDSMKPGDPVVHQLFSTLSSIGSRETATINNLIDAAALAGLGRLIREADGHLVRFYSETNVVRSLFADSRTSGLLSEEVTAHPETVFRDEDYFVVRCSFPAVGFPYLALERESREGGSLEELSVLHSELKDAVSGPIGPDDLTTMLSKIRVKERSLSDIVADFARLRFLEEVVCDWDVPRDWEDVLPNLHHAFSSEALLLGTRESLRKSFDEVSDDLKSQMGSLRDWQQQVHRIQGIITKRRREIRAGEHLPSLDQDIGLGRWGLQRQLSSTDEIMAGIQTILHGEHDEVAELASNLALLVVAPDNEQGAVEYGMVMLWILHLSGDVWNLWRRDGRREWQSSLGLEILALVSRIKQLFLAAIQDRYNDPTSEFSRIVQDADRLTDQIRGSERGYALMGVAHIKYWAWKRLHDQASAGLLIAGAGKQGQRSGPAHHPSEADSNKWAENSFDAAAEAAQLFPPQSIEWAFAVNHCAYVGLAAGIREVETQRYYQALEATQDLHGHYRFADTLALRHTLEARRLLQGITPHTSTSGAKSGTETRRREACRRLLIAKQILGAAHPYFGDEEVIAHVRLVEEISMQFQCWELE